MSHSGSDHESRATLLLSLKSVSIFMVVLCQSHCQRLTDKLCRTFFLLLALL